MSVSMFFEAVFFAALLSLDAFFVSFSYGSKQIKIPFPSVLMISGTCSAALGLSFFAGSLLQPFLSARFCSILSFLILFGIGIFNLQDSLLHTRTAPGKIDLDCSMSISLPEALSLGIALSLDGLAAGFGAALGNVNGLIVTAASFLTGISAVLLGNLCGEKLMRRLKLKLSWLSGALLILMAFLKLR